MEYDEYAVVSFEFSDANELVPKFHISYESNAQWAHSFKL